MPAAHGATITPALESSNAIAVAIQLLNGRGKPLVGRAVVRAFITTDSQGLAPVEFVSDDTVPSTGVKGEVLTDEDGSLELLSAADGRIDLVLTNASDQTKTRYLNVALGNGAVLPPVSVGWSDNTP